MKNFFTWVVAVLITGMPLAVSAQSNQLITASGTFGDIITAITKNILGALTTLFASAALAAFFFGIVKFILGLRNGDAKDVTFGKQFMGWGLVALFVMFSVWGIIRYGQTVLGLPQGSNIIIPTIKFGNDPSSSNSNQNTSTPTNTSPLGGGQTGSQIGDGICLAYGPGTGCTTSSGAVGVCSANGVCVANSSTGGYTSPTSSSCGRRDSFGTCCDQQNQYIDNYGVCQSAFD